MATSPETKEAEETTESTEARGTTETKQTAEPKETTETKQAAESKETTETKETEAARQTAETKQTKAGLSNKVVIISALVVVMTVTGAALAIISALNRQEPAPLPSSNIGYSTVASVILSQADLQAAYNQALANAKNGNIALMYKNNAFSTDGSNFSCYIVNSPANKFDMFLTMYADLEMTDQVFLSQLIPPGSGFENLTLEHALEKGTHTIYVCLTQVDRDPETGEESICGQVFHTMDFHVVDG